MNVCVYQIYLNCYYDWQKSNILPGILNSIEINLISLGIRVQLLSVIRGFVQYVIIIDQDWTMYTYVHLVLKESTTYIMYKSPHICEDLVCVCKYY